MVEPYTKWPWVEPHHSRPTNADLEDIEIFTHFVIQQPYAQIVVPNCMESYRWTGIRIVDTAPYEYQHSFEVQIPKSRVILEIQGREWIPLPSVVQSGTPIVVRVKYSTRNLMGKVELLAQKVR